MSHDLKLPINYNTISQAKRREVREEYIRRQNNKCHHCQEELDGPPANKILSLRINTALFPKNFFKWPVHLHHNHTTGMTIGAVHSRCNAVLWQYHNE